MLATLNEQVFPCSETQAYSPYCRLLYMLFLDRMASSGHSDMSDATYCGILSQLRTLQLYCLTR